MKAVVYLGPGRIEVADIPDPQIIHPRDAIVRVTLTAIDESVEHHGEPALPPGPEPSLGQRGHLVP